VASARRVREDIPIAARIVAVADVFDALTHARPYKEAWPVEDAVAEIQRQRGRQFDPQVVDAFVALVSDEGIVHRSVRGGDASSRPLFPSVSLCLCGSPERSSLCLRVSVVVREC
jgi:HD-GYP domain-containing protein (c-di-GMP phosphodiesterase class II)